MKSLDEITTDLHDRVKELKRKEAEPDRVDEAYLAKLESQRSIMSAADFKAAKKAVEQMQRSAQLLLCRRIAEAVSEALGPLNIPLTPGTPKQRRRSTKRAAVPQEQKAARESHREQRVGEELRDDATTSAPGCEGVQEKPIGARTPTGLDFEDTPDCEKGGIS